MYVAEIWRYPVKSLAGEQLQTTQLGPAGIPFDRTIQVRRPDGRILTSRNYPRLLSMRATVDAVGQVLVDGLPWKAPAVAARIREAAREDAALGLHEDPEERFDVLPLLVGTESAFATIGYDRRRFRPNLVIGGTTGYEERSWPGRRLQIGSAIIAARQLRSRCVMTTYDPDTHAQDLNVLKRIVNELGGRIALDCEVVQAGNIAVGDEVRLLESAADE